MFDFSIYLSKLWIGIFIVSILYELIKMNLFGVWIALGAVGAQVSGFLHAPSYIQATVFLFISALLLFTVRPFGLRFVHRAKSESHVKGMIGKTCFVISEIDNSAGIGKVRLGDVEWSARSYKKNVIYPVGTVVKIVDVIGVKLIVKAK